MDKQDRRKNESTAAGRVKDFFVVLFCICGITGCLYLFYLDMFATFRSLFAVPAGTVTVRYNTVQRRTSDRVIWDRLFAQSPVYNGDLIRIAKQSGAILNIDNNSIELGENTLIRIQKDTSGSPLQIEFFSGDVSVSSSAGRSPVLLSVGSQVVEVSPGGTVNASAGEAGLVLRVTEGAAQVRNEGQVMNLQAGNIAVQDTFNDRLQQVDTIILPLHNTSTLNTGERPPALSLRLPEGDGAVVIGGLQDYYFTWAPSRDAASYLFQIFSERDLNTAVLSATVRDNFYIYRRNERTLAPGQYYWSVTYTTIEGNVSLPTVPRTFNATYNTESLEQIKASDEMLDSGFTFTEFVRPQPAEAEESAETAELIESTEPALGSTELAESPVSQMAYDTLTPEQQAILALLSPEQIALLSQEQLSQLSILPLGQLLEAASMRPEQLASVTPQEIQTRFQPPPTPPPPAMPAQTPAQTAPQALAQAPAQAARVTQPQTASQTQAPRAAQPQPQTTRQQTPRELTPRELAQREQALREQEQREQREREQREREQAQREQAQREQAQREQAQRDREQREQRPLLPAPDERQPASGYRIGAEELRQQRNILFSWAAVEGATSYILSIYREGFPGRVQIFQTDPLTELSYNFDNFTLFNDSGTFFWHVEAIVFSDEGNFEQGGLLAENTFILDIPRPGRVRARDTGVLYGRN